MAKIVVALMASTDEAERIVNELSQTCACERAKIGLLKRGGDAPSVAFANAGLGAEAASGSLVDALGKAGVAKNEAEYYEDGVQRGGTLVMVHASTDAMAQCAAKVMRGGVSDAQASGSRENEVLPVIEEELVVGKREIGRGAVRIYTYVNEVPVEETVQLREEHAKVERRPVDRPVTADAQPFQEQTIEVRETAEELVVTKRARVVEEVVVSKDVTQREETVHDTVRKTDVRVERTAPGGVERRKRAGTYAGVERRSTIH